MENLPLSVLVHISLFLPIKSIFNFGVTCKKNAKILDCELIWKELSKRECQLHNDFQTYKEYVKEGRFEWSCKENQEYFVLENERRKVIFVGENETEIEGEGEDREERLKPLVKNVVSRSILRGKGIYQMEVLIHTKEEDCFCFGVCDLGN